MPTILSIEIEVNEKVLSPARVVEELTKGFVLTREHYFRVSEDDLNLKIETITVGARKRKPKTHGPITVTVEREDSVE